MLSVYRYEQSEVEISVFLLDTLLPLFSKRVQAQTSYYFIFVLLAVTSDPEPLATDIASKTAREDHYHLLAPDSFAAFWS